MSDVAGRAVACGRATRKRARAICNGSVSESTNAPTGSVRFAGRTSEMCLSDDVEGCGGLADFVVPVIDEELEGNCRIPFCRGSRIARMFLDEVADGFISSVVPDTVYQAPEVVDVNLSDEVIKKYALVEVEKLLQNADRSWHEFPKICSEDVARIFNVSNRFIFDELNYDVEVLRLEYDTFLAKCTDEQLVVHDCVLRSVDSGNGGFYFVYGCGGTGKTFVWNILSAVIWSRDEIVINVASSRIASLLLPGGRTAHSRFKIPIDIMENSTCNILQGSLLADLIVRSSRIIWDEAPMLSRYCFEALDRTVSDLMCFSRLDAFSRPFGGKTVVLGGDFRQLLPVISKGSRQDVVYATINSSYLWQDCVVLKLTKNMRLCMSTLVFDFDEARTFSNWLELIGDGTFGGPNDGDFDIELSDDILLKYDGNPISAIVDYVYLSHLDVFGCSDFFRERAMLAPTLDSVDLINDYIISSRSGPGRLYLSADTMCNSVGDNSMFGDVHTPDFLNSLRCSGLPNHHLFLKIGTPVMLLRNIEQDFLMVCAMVLDWLLQN